MRIRRTPVRRELGMDSPDAYEVMEVPAMKQAIEAYRIVSVTPEFREKDVSTVKLREGGAA